MLRVFVAGTPIPQGSKQIVRRRLVDVNPQALKAWRKTIRTAVEVLHHGERIEDVAVVVDAEFRMPRPASVRRPYPSVRPDVDKLARALCDALTEARVWKDDGQVVRLTASKVYSDRPGVLVRVGRHIPTEGESTCPM